MFPSPFSTSTTTNELHFYQGVMVIEVAFTFLVYLVLYMIHYIKWGYDDERRQENLQELKKEEKQKGKGEEKVADEEISDKKWDMKMFNESFCIIFANHVVAMALVITYIPYIFSTVISFLHFAAFIALVILQIFIKDVEPGKGSKTIGSRIVWAIMCLFNIMLIIAGLTGVINVLS